MAESELPLNTPIGGLVCFYGEYEWIEAMFALTDDDRDGSLLIYRGSGALVAPTMVRLSEVTALDEITEGMDKPALAGFHRIEIQASRSILCQAIWPSTFTDRLIPALQRTVDSAQSV